MRFDDDSNVWANSEICSWLNNDFYNTAFDETEQGFIKPVDINFKEDGSDDYNFDGSSYNVFLLSKAEALKYFPNQTGKCEPTAYAVKHRANTNVDYGGWWLRSPLSDYDNIVYLVRNDGIIGSRVSDVYSNYGLVRPALWIKINN